MTSLGDCGDCGNEPAVTRWDWIDKDLCQDCCTRRQSAALKSLERNRRRDIARAVTGPECQAIGDHAPCADSRCACPCHAVTTIARWAPGAVA